MNEQVGLELLTLRVRNKKTINEVAEGVGIDPSTISRYENNKNSISIETVEKLLKYYNADVSIFFNNVSANMHK